jgi:hypothetical protein
MDQMDLKVIEVISTIFQIEENQSNLFDKLLERIASIQIPIKSDDLNYFIESIT